MRDITHKLNPGTRRWLADFASVLALFWIAAFALGSSHDPAHALHTPKPTAAVPEHQSKQTAITWTSASVHKARAPREHPAERTFDLVLLSMTVAALAALNLAFWRHLRRVYASPRRGVWRRG